MRVIIAGGRNIVDYHLVEAAVQESGFAITEVISGTANGADQLGEEWGRRHNVPVHRYPADWNQYGRSAGYRRNEQMAYVAEALVLIWDGVSKGSKHMLDIAVACNLPVYVKRVELKEAHHHE